MIETETRQTLIRKITITNRKLRIPKIHKLVRKSRSHTVHDAYGVTSKVKITGRWSVCGLYTMKDRPGALRVRHDIRDTWKDVDCGSCLRRKEKYHHGKASSQAGGSEDK